MRGVPFTFTATARMEPSQFVAICEVGDDSGIFRTGRLCSSFLAISKFFKVTTISSGFVDPTMTIPWELELATMLARTPKRLLLDPSNSCDLLCKRNAMS